MSFEEDLAAALTETLLGHGARAELVGEVEFGHAPDGTPLMEMTTDVYLTAEQLAAALGISPDELDPDAPAVDLDIEQVRRALRHNATPRAVPAWAPPEPPRRGTDSYHSLIWRIATLEELEKVTAALSGMWELYGWRGVLDVMAAWVIQIQDHPNADPEVRGVDGAVNIAVILVTEPDEDHLLRMAHDIARDAIAAGQAPHEAFKLALERSQNAVGLTRRWLPHIRNAFVTARDESSTFNRERLVFADLYHGPGREDRHELIQIAILLGTAAMGVRNKQALARAARDLTPGRIVVDNGEINPRWKSGYKRRSNG